MKAGQLPFHAITSTDVEVSRLDAALLRVFLKISIY